MQGQVTACRYMNRKQRKQNLTLALFLSYTYTENLFVYREIRRPFITVLNNVSNFWFTQPPQLTNFVASELAKNFYTYYTTILSITVPVENYRNAKECYSSNFRRENIREQHEIHESFLPRKFPAIQYGLSATHHPPTLHLAVSLPLCLLCHLLVIYRQTEL